MLACVMSHLVGRPSYFNPHGMYVVMYSALHVGHVYTCMSGCGAKLNKQHPEQINSGGKNC